ncbi:MAG: CBS domain-containing protein [Proteobacteria bacterium]|nr:CBS domain-containing protein [Pseudomonadota bacterium]
MVWSQPVRTVMVPDPVCVTVSMTPSAVYAVLDAHTFHHVPVLEDGALVGVISTLDIAKVSLGAWVHDAETEDAWMDRQFRIRDIMTWEPEFVRDTDSLRHAADRLAEGSFHCLPVLDASDKLVGILTSTDLLRLIGST